VVVLSDAPPTPPRQLRAAWGRLPVAWRRAVVAALVLRAGAAVLALVGGGLLPGLDPVAVAPGEGFAGWTTAPPGAQGWGLVGAGLERFDALWYLAIAADGYPPAVADVPPQAAAFLPAYPLLVAALAGLLGGALLLAANLVSLAATTAGFAGLHRLAELGIRRDGATPDPDLPRRTVVVAAVFPSAFFLVAPYTEGLFLAAAAWSLVWLLRRRWWPAAGTLALAGATRNVGVLLAVAALAEVVAATRTGGARDGARWAGRGAAVLAAPAGLAAYLAYGAVRWGTWLAPVEVQTGWQRELRWPWETLVDAVRIGFADPGGYTIGYQGLDVLVVLPVLAVVAWLVARGRWSLALLAVAHVLVWLVYPFPPRPLMSTARFVLAVPPVFVAAAALLTTRGRETTWVAASAALLGVHLLLFTAWYYVF
jgi:hypothetical protein